MAPSALAAAGELVLEEDHDQQEGAADDGLPVGAEADGAAAVFEVEDVEDLPEFLRKDQAPMMPSVTHSEGVDARS